MSYTNDGAATIPSGSVVVFAAMIGVALGDIIPSGEGELATQEVWELAKAPTLEIAPGDQLYWDAVNKQVNKTATDNVACGKAWSKAASADAAVQVKLNA